MNDKVLPFAGGQKELIEATEKLWCLRFRKSAYEKKFCDVDDVDDEVKDIKEIQKEAITKIKNQKQTNFDCITKSPEALAKFISKAERIYEKCCNDGDCDSCKCQWCGVAGRSELVEWLKQEVK